MIKSFSCEFFVLIVVGGLFFGGLGNLGVVHASTEVTGIISSDTTWIRANSPYSLTGAILVSEGATLTIESGVTVNLNDYYIRVNGTLRAIGNSTDKIFFNGEYIDFRSGSTSWNEQTGNGNIIEHAILNRTAIITTTDSDDVVAVKISNNVFEFTYLGVAIDVNGGLILNNIIHRPIIVNGSTEVSDNVVFGQISAYGSSTISGNNVTGSIYVNGSPRILYNNISAQINGLIETGISMDGEDDAYICGNVISGFMIGIRATRTSIIEKNLITDNVHGIAMGYDAKPVIRNNTISNNSDGIYCPTKDSTIIYNNLQNNSNYNINLGAGSKNDINATYNYWGTPDTQAINMTIHDYKHDFDLGTVSFVPFLTEPNPQAPSDIIPELPSWMLLPLFLTVTFVVIVARKKLVC